MRFYPLPKAPPLLSIIIPIFNEELLLPRVVENISKLGGYIFILDSFSMDRLLEIAQSFGAHIHSGQWQSFSDKLNWGLNHLPIKTEWAMR